MAGKTLFYTKNNNILYHIFEILSSIPLCIKKTMAFFATGHIFIFNYTTFTPVFWASNAICVPQVLKSFVSINVGSIRESAFAANFHNNIFLSK